MRPSRLTPLALIVLTAAAVAACAGSAPGWTYAPAPPITPPPSVEPSADPSAAPSGSVGPSAAPSVQPSGSVSPSGDATVLEIAALNILFDRDTLAAPVDQPFQIVFANNDPGIPHNVEIRDGSGASLFLGEVFNGVETRTYDVPALSGGTYSFLCTVHPTTMLGTLSVGG